MRMDRLRLLQALIRRLEIADGDDGDPAVLLHPATADDLVLLAELTTEDDYVAAQILARTHWERYQRLPKPTDQADLDAMIAWSVRALPGIPPGNPHRVRLVYTLASALAERYLRTEAPGDLELAVGILEDESNAIEQVDLAIVSHKASQVRRLHYAHSGEPSDLDLAVAWQRRALNALGEHPLRAQYLVDLAEVLHRCFEVVGRRNQLDEAIEVCRAALDNPGTSRATREQGLGVLGRALSSRAEHDGRLADLTASIAAFDVAMAEGADTTVDAGTMNELADALRMRFEWAGDIGDIDRAIATARSGAASSLTGSTQEANCLATLSVALLRRHERTGSPVDLAHAIEAGEKAFLTAGTADARAGRASNLAATLYCRYERSGSLADLDRAVDLLQSAADLRGPGVEPLGILANLGLMLSSRYERRRNVADLEAAITTMRQAVDGVPTAHRMRPGLVANLAFALRMRFDEKGDEADLTEALRLGQEAVDATSDDHPAMPGHLSNLSNSWLAKYLHSAVHDDLEQACDLGRRATELTAVGTAAAAGIWHSYAGVLLERFDQLGERPDLAKAITLLDQALDTLPDNEPARGRYSALLAKALDRRFERTDAQADLDRAIQALRLAVAAVPSDHPEGASLVDRLATSLRTRFERRAAFADIDEAISIVRTAAAALPPGHADRAGHTAVLGSLLTTRFTHSGIVGDLDEAVRSHRQALTELGPHHAVRAMLLSNLAGALLERSRRSGAIADIDEAIEAGRQAVATARDNDADRASYRMNLGTALNTRYERTGKASDLQESITHLHVAAETLPRDHGDRALYLANLSLAVERGYAVLTDDPAQLDSSVALSEASLASMPLDHPYRALLLSNLALALLSRFGVSGNKADLQRAVTHAGQAVSICAPGHPHRAGFLNNLGLAYWGQAMFEHDVEARSNAMAAYREATEIEAAPPIHRARAGRQWARIAAGAEDLDQASDAWDTVIDLLPLVTDQELDRSDRQHHLSLLGAMGRNAAMVALGRGDVAKAWSVLELGRGVLLSQAFQGRSETDSLRADYPELADEADRLRRLLNTEIPREQRRRAAEEWQRLLTTIRALPAFDRYALPPTAHDLRLASAGGTVAAVNIGPHRCDCLLLDEHGEDHLPLPGLTQKDTVEQANRLLKATGRGSPAEVSDVLKWLWDHVTEPILQHLKGDQTRIWWMPTGPLTALPLHAAGYHDQRGRSDGRTVLDQVVSSYTPTVHMLHQARRRRPAPERTVVAVGINDATQASGLLHAVAEAKDVHKRFPTASQLLLNQDATRAKVLAGLDRTTWAHLACHAASSQDPADSCLALADGPLPVKDIMSRELRQPYLAFLSACTTAFGGAALLDEAIHMASAFQVAGYPHAIGTLWPVADAIAPAFAKLVYNEMESGSEPAYALHHATRNIRDLYPDRPYLWAAHVHFGP